MVLKATLVSALAPFGLVEVGAKIGAELDNILLCQDQVLQDV